MEQYIKKYLIALQLYDAQRTRMALGVLGKILAIIICLVLFLLSAIIRKHTKSTFHPAFIYTLYSGLLYLLSMLIIFPAPINPLGLLYILLCIISFCVPTLLTDYNNVRTVRSLNKLDADIALSRFESTVLRKLLSFMAILGDFCSIYIVVIIVDPKVKTTFLSK